MDVTLMSTLNVARVTKLESLFTNTHPRPSLSSGCFTDQSKVA